MTLAHPGVTPSTPRRAILLILLCISGCAAQPSLRENPQALLAASRARPGQSVALMKAEGERLAHKSFVAGNSATLLINGPASFAALADAITHARHRIDMESYEFDATAGAQFGQLLLEARARGVQVNLIYDGYGTLHTPNDVFANLRAGGINTLEYNPLTPNARVPVDINRRDHRKLLCVDSRVAVTGGVNITRVYQNAPGLYSPNVDDEAWRDTDVRIEGPVVGQFETYFMHTWRDQHGPPLDPPPPSPLTMLGPLLVQAIDGAPSTGRPLIYRTLIAAIVLAQRSVHLTTGYFAPTPDLLLALEGAARRGVDVQLVLPARSDNDFVIPAGRATYGELLKAGVGIHERLHRILHAKTAVIDGAWSAVGSSNLDWRSTVLNNEIDAIILGSQFGVQMEVMFARDVAASHTITLAEWRDRSLLERIKEWRSELIQELL